MQNHFCFTFVKLPFLSEIFNHLLEEQAQLSGKLQSFSSCSFFYKVVYVIFVYVIPSIHFYNSKSISVVPLIPTCLLAFAQSCYCRLSDYLCVIRNSSLWNLKPHFIANCHIM